MQKTIKESRPDDFNKRYTELKTAKKLQGDLTELVFEIGNKHEFVENPQQL